MAQLKKKAVLLIGALMLLLGMGMNLQYALDDYGWADNLAVQVLAAVTGDFDTSWRIQINQWSREKWQEQNLAFYRLETE